MPRIEFSRKIKGEAFLRCDGKCEKCSAKLKVGEGDFDHILPCEFGGEATLDNCQVLCIPCHRGPGGKTADDIRAIRKSDRIRDKHRGTFPATRNKIKSRGFGRRNKNDEEDFR